MTDSASSLVGSETVFVPWHLSDATEIKNLLKVLRRDNDLLSMDKVTASRGNDFQSISPDLDLNATPIIAATL